MSEAKREQVIALGRLGWSLRRIEAETGVRRETASGYLQVAGVTVRAPRHRKLEPKPASDSEVITGFSAEISRSGVSNPASREGVISGSPSRSPIASACEVHREFIEQSLVLGRNAMAIWQDLTVEHGFAAKYSSVHRFVRKLAATSGPEAKAIIETAPGEEAQVDYGEGPMVRAPHTGKFKRTRLFVLTLGYSRKCVRLLCWNSSSEMWAELHEKAFARLGGVPRVIVLDNLKEGVTNAEFYDPALNPLYKAMLAHYGVVALPCRVRHPDRKGKVEAGIGHTQRTPLKGLRFETLEDAQAHLDRWDERFADTRIHGTTKRQVASMFAEEKPHLRALPTSPFRRFEYGVRTVHLDGCVEIAAAYYSTPPGLIGKQVAVEWNERWVRILDPKTRQLLREHLRQQRGRHRVDPHDVAPRTPASTDALLRRAAAAGVNIGRLCKRIHANDGEPGVRRILGVLNLAKKHGVACADDASKVALEIGAPTYRFVRTYIKRSSPLQLTLKQVDPLIRELTHYKQVIENIEKGDQE